MHELIQSIQLYDTTLRDGRQSKGFDPSVDARIKITKLLDPFVEIIEGGWPGAAHTDDEYFARIRDTKLHHARMAAFGSTRHANVHVETDNVLKHLLEAETPVCTLVGKSSIYHVLNVLRTSPEENLAMVGDSIKFLKTTGREVGFDAEHFFDGYRSDPDYALTVLETAAINGTDWITLCDTNGGTLTWEIEETVRVIIEQMKLRLKKQETLSLPRIGIHAHNDFGCAIANTLSGVRGGATQIQGTINGYGERAGNADLIPIMAILQTRMGYSCLTPDLLSQLTSLSRTIATLAGLTPDRKQPFVGEDAFAHKAGLHADAVSKDPCAYEHSNPQSFGNNRRFVVSEYGGKGSARPRIEDLGLGIKITDDFARLVISKVKDMEAQGFRYENADASFELLVRRLLSDYQPAFQLHLSDVSRDQAIKTFLSFERQPKEKTIEEIIPSQEGINGRFQALQNALESQYPFLKLIQLENPNTQSENGNINRVFIHFYDGQKRWTTVGAHSNSSHASWLAIGDGIEYALLHPAS